MSPEAEDNLRSQVLQLPEKAGVYLFIAGSGQVLYVGKAKNLKARVRQYLAGQDQRAMVRHLLGDARKIEVVLVDTEKEALILENTLIKKHKPRYNVNLRDDKAFLHLRVDLAQDWPRHVLVRRIRPDGARYFGPYHSAAQARKTLATLRKHFPLRTCADTVLRNRSRPCILYQMGRCLAPCVGIASRAQYSRVLDDANLFLSGRKHELLSRLGAKMMALADKELFEEAARLRDTIRAIQATLERQRVLDTRLGDRDVWGLYREGDDGVLAVLPVREGAMHAPTYHSFQRAIEDDHELLSAVMARHYALAPTEGESAVWLPAELLLPLVLPDARAMEQLLSAHGGKRVRVRFPRKGDKLRLVEMASRNARERFVQQTDRDSRSAMALEALARICGLPAPPRRIECFDNSNLGGTDPVASMVVFEEGKPLPREYRRYKVKTVQGPDDYATMHEILSRRFTRARESGEYPDLVVVDGGRGQVMVALEVLSELRLDNLPVIGLAKPRSERSRGQRQATDKIVLPRIRDPIRLKPNDPALNLLRRLRDESHSYAVRYHRKLRNRRNLESVLLEVPGLGPARARALLRHFGSVKRILEADEAQLRAVKGMGPGLARKLFHSLHPGDEQ